MVVRDEKFCCAILFCIRMFCIFCRSFCHVRKKSTFDVQHILLICYEFFNIFIYISQSCKMLATIHILFNMSACYLASNVGKIMLANLVMKHREGWCLCGRRAFRGSVTYRSVINIRNNSVRHLDKQHKD